MEDAFDAGRDARESGQVADQDAFDTATDAADSEAESVPIFSSSNHDAELEANTIHSVLEASGIESMVVGPSTIPTLEFQVQVPRSQVAEAQRILTEARDAGPSAADEAEMQGERESGAS